MTASVAPEDASLCEHVAQTIDIETELAGLEARACPFLFREPFIDGRDHGSGRLARHHDDAVGIADDHKLSPARRMSFASARAIVRTIGAVMRDRSSRRKTAHRRCKKGTREKGKGTRK